MRKNRGKEEKHGKEQWEKNDRGVMKRRLSWKTGQKEKKSETEGNGSKRGGSSRPGLLPARTRHDVRRGRGRSAQPVVGGGSGAGIRGQFRGESMAAFHPHFPAAVSFFCLLVTALLHSFKKRKCCTNLGSNFIIQSLFKGGGVHLLRDFAVDQ